MMINGMHYNPDCGCKSCQQANENMNNKKTLQDYEEQADKIIAEFFNYTDGVRMLMLIHRSKEGGKLGDRNKKNVRKISNNRDEFREMLIELLKEKDKRSDVYRIYSCVNERNLDKAIRIFKQRQLDADYYDKDSKYKFYTDIKNSFLSALMSPQARNSTQFLLDIDDGLDIKTVKEKLTQITRNFITYKTKNGWHIISQPFNPTLLPNVPINKDGLLLLNY